jgi:hypothetical protein
VVSTLHQQHTNTTGPCQETDRQNEATEDPLPTNSSENTGLVLGTRLHIVPTDVDKLHRQLGHPAPSQLLQVRRNAHYANKDDLRRLEAAVRQHKCELYAPRAPRATPHAETSGGSRSGCALTRTRSPHRHRPLQTSLHRSFSGAGGDR